MQTGKNPASVLLHLTVGGEGDGAHTMLVPLGEGCDAAASGEVEDEDLGGASAPLASSDKVTTPGPCIVI